MPRSGPSRVCAGFSQPASTWRRKRQPSIAAAALLLFLAACQPLPHPFADDVPKPGSPILSLRDMASVSIAPLAGGPRATAVKLAPAMAAALQERDVAASNRAVGLDSYHLLGRIQAMPPSDGKAAVVAVWQLREPSGRLIGERSERVEARAADWDVGDADAVGRLAAAGAEDLAALIQDKPPVEAAVGGRTQLLFGGVEGAPGDGGRALEKAITSLLERRDVAIVTDPQKKADLVLAAEVTVDPQKAGKQHVKIVWHVRYKEGAEIGTVAQENDVPNGLLDGAWGDVAYTVAMAAQDGILALVARGAPAEGGAPFSGQS
jgi:hypothetical protein